MSARKKLVRAGDFTRPACPNCGEMKNLITRTSEERKGEHLVLYKICRACGKRFRIDYVPKTS